MSDRPPDVTAAARARGDRKVVQDSITGTATPKVYRFPPSATTEDVRKFRVGLFVRDLHVLLDRLTPAEFHVYHRFRCEYVYTGAMGIVDNDADLARRLKCKAWPKIKSKLHTTGCIYTEAGVLRDKDLDVSIERQRKTSLRQATNSKKRWTVGTIGGAA